MRRVEVGAGPRGERGAHPLVELVVIEPPLRESLLQPLRDGVPVLVGRADRGRTARLGLAVRRSSRLLRSSDLLLRKIAIYLNRASTAVSRYLPVIMAVC